MFEGHDQAIHDLLASRRGLPAAVLQSAWAEHRATGRPLSRVLLESGRVSPEELGQAVAFSLDCDWRATLPDALAVEVASLIDAGTARAFGIVPLAAARDTLEVAALDPFAPDLVADLAFRLGRRVRLTVADPDQVRTLLDRHYADAAPLDTVMHELRAGAGSTSEAGGEAVTEADLEKLAGQPPIIRFVNLVLAQAVREGASDLHFEPFGGKFRIRCRVDGTLRDLPPPPPSLALPVVSRLKVLANLNIAERRLPQDGRLRLEVAGREVDLRVSTLPTQFGESVVLRVLDQSARRLALGQLGLPAALHAALTDLIHRPHGLVIVTGPTGSGKTTTLYSCLQELNTVAVKVLTVEDPVEYELDGVMQVPVNPAAGLGFARALRSFLRQDPDIVMIGEIRDAETARIAVQAALTGHLVLATLHTNDAASAVTRLLDLGVEPFLLASTLEVVLAQRLLRRVCPACRAPYVPTVPELNALGLEPPADPATRFHRARGCPECQASGYRGRLGLFELLCLTEPLRDLVVRGASLVELRQQATAGGCISLRAAAATAVLAGETTVEEAVKYV